MSGETFTEYGLSYRGDEPRRGTWTTNYDEAMRDAAYREMVHGDDIGPLAVVQRNVTMTATPWEPAVRPAVDATEPAVVAAITEED